MFPLTYVKSVHIYSIVIFFILITYILFPLVRKLGFIGDIFTSTLRNKVRFINGIFHIGREPQTSYETPQTSYGSPETSNKPSQAYEPSVSLSDSYRPSGVPSSNSYKPPRKPAYANPTKGTASAASSGKRPQLYSSSRPRYVENKQAVQ
jgi:hypothetical protein